jgi:elongation factor G
VALETETIRNVCLIGHRGSGKTLIAEGMLGLASGRNAATSGTLDYTEEETERGMTLGMSVASLDR